MESVIPFIEEYINLPPGANVLEIGCGEGGVLKSFIEKGYNSVGIELEEGRVRMGTQWLGPEIADGRMRFIVEDIFNISASSLEKKFHLIVLKDVIEHLPNKEMLLERMKRFLHPEGVIFFGFPPWQMPFGGHQQMCRNKYLSKLPWFHLLPRPVYKSILQAFKKEPVSDLLDVYDTRISIEGFESLVNKSNYQVVGKRHFLVAPIYRYKFGLKERRQLAVLRRIPFFRNLFTTAVYYLVTPSTPVVSVSVDKYGSPN